MKPKELAKRLRRGEKWRIDMGFSNGITEPEYTVYCENCGSAVEVSSPEAIVTRCSGCAERSEDEG